jgi:hypothetical protein
MPTTYSTYVTLTANYTGVAGLSQVETVRYAPADVNYASDSPGFVTPSTSSAMTTVSGPAAATTAMKTYFYQTGGAQQQVIENIGGTDTTYAVDAATTLLPWIGQVTFDLSGKIVVPLDHTGTTSDAPDLLYAEGSYSRMIDAQTSQNVIWIAAGPGGGDVTLPKLNANLAFLNPRLTDTASGFSQAVMLESSVINGWDDVRPNLFGLINSFDQLRGSTAKVRVSQSNRPD